MIFRQIIFSAPIVGLLVGLVMGLFQVRSIAEVVETLARWYYEFVITSAVSILAFWLALGLVSVWLLNIWVVKGVHMQDDEPARV